MPFSHPLLIRTQYIVNIMSVVMRPSPQQQCKSPIYIASSKFASSNSREARARDATCIYSYIVINVQRWVTKHYKLLLCAQMNIEICLTFRLSRPLWSARAKCGNTLITHTCTRRACAHSTHVARKYFAYMCHNCVCVLVAMFKIYIYEQNECVGDCVDLGFEDGRAFRFRIP